MKRGVQKRCNFERFEDDINIFYEDLKNHNFSNEQIAKVFNPMLLENEKWTMFKCIMFIAFPIIIYSLIQSDYFYDNISWYLLAISRVLLIKIHPIYDWTHLKDQQCLLPKWWERKIENNFTPNCNLCENLKDIYVYDRLSPRELTEFYLDIQKPVILTDDTWSNLDEFFNDIIQDDFLLSSMPCSLQTNMIDGSSNLEQIMKKILEFESLFVYFQNCEYESMKHFRKISPKPKYLPPSISPVQYNWLLWVRNYTFPKYKTINLANSENIKIIGEISGRLSFRLTPPVLCKELCSELEITLNANQFLIFTNFWKLHFKNVDNDTQDSVAAISEVHSLL
ncbi:hypothetical protein WA026_002608 [Henosepilachna vigintioctopunctata]|uniref:Uncharacterized protein n=1 Tax=Henosepilachna vigintioctopunctata TaxID=420089 RepID=A0AAW1U0V4_9CUCU